MARRSLVPVAWTLFSAGGTLAALMMPSLVLLFGLAFPLGWLSPPDHAHLLSVAAAPLTRVALAALCTLSLFHWAHRFRYALYDGLQLKHLDVPIRILCYGGAIFGSVVAVYLIARIP